MRIPSSRPRHPGVAARARARASLAGIAAVVSLLFFAPAAAAEAPPEPPASAPSPPAPPYSLPWQLRPVVAATAVRADTAFAFYEDSASRGGLTEASILAGSVRIPGTGKPSYGLTAILRLASSQDSPPAGNGGFVVVNPQLGAAYAFPLGAGFRGSAYLAATIPVGMGGGDSPNPGQVDARMKAQYARSEMDNSIYAVNDFAVIPGLDLAWVKGGFTMQAEATLFELARVRGAQSQPEASKTNFTSGVHAGYFIVPAVSLGAEVRYQRWFNAPISVDKDPTGTLVDNWTFAVGPRFHIHLGRTTFIRPGIAYARGLDKPMAAATPNYNIVFVDVPVVF